MCVGDVFGPRELRPRIGVDGMGGACQAYDTVTDRVVALELPGPESAADQNFQQRFRRESRIPYIDPSCVQGGPKEPTTCHD